MYIHKYVYTHMYICIYIHCKFTCIYINIYLYMHVYIYVRIYMYVVHTYTRWCSIWQQATTMSAQTSSNHTHVIKSKKNNLRSFSPPPSLSFLSLSHTHAHARMQVAHFCGESLDEIQQYLNELGEPYLVEAIDTKGIFNF